jgi:zinc protease
MSAGIAVRRPPRLGACPVAGVLLALLLLAPRVPASAVPATPPQPQPMRELRFPAFAEQTLPNGLRLVLIERHTEPEVSLRLLVPAGKLFEPADRAGLAGATADLLTQGTDSRTAQQIAGIVDGVGGSLAAASATDFAYVSVAVTSDQLDLALDLLSDVVLHPSFPAAEIERWRRKSLSNLALQRANAGYLAGLAFQRAVFGAHPYALPQGGTPETVRALTRDDLVAFHRRHFLPNGAILAVVGDFRPEQAVASVQRALGSWAAGEAPHPPPLAAGVARRRVIVIDKPDAVQTQIRVGQAALAYTDPDYFTAAVYNTILGGGSSGRLFQEIRRRHGLAYGAYSAFAEQLVGGSFSASTSTKTASTVEALRLTLELIDGMGKAPVPAAQLDEAKAYLNGSFPLEMETARSAANSVLIAFSYGLGRDFLDTYRQRVSAVTAADVQRFAAGRLHADSMVVVLVGNAAAFGPDLAKLVGPYETIPAADLDPMAPDLKRH